MVNLTFSANCAGRGWNPADQVDIHIGRYMWCRYWDQPPPSNSNHGNGPRKNTRQGFTQIVFYPSLGAHSKVNLDMASLGGVVTKPSFSFSKPSFLLHGMNADSTLPQVHKVTWAVSNSSKCRCCSEWRIYFMLQCSGTLWIYNDIQILRVLYIVCICYICSICIYSMYMYVYIISVDICSMCMVFIYIYIVCIYIPGI